MFAKSIKVRGCVAAIVLLMTLLSACEDSYVINIGHGAHRIGLIPEISIGIRSKTDEFDMDDVTLEFSWGNEDGIGEGECIFIPRGEKEVLPEECPVVCVAVYFYNYKYYTALTSRYHYVDYKEIEGVHFVKDFTVEEFNEKCKVDLNYWGRKKYDHTESLTIPKEVFENDSYILLFGVVKIAYIPSENAYVICGGNATDLNYKVLENGKIRLS